MTAPTAHGLRPAHAALTRAARRRIAAAFCIVSDVFIYFYYLLFGAWCPTSKSQAWAVGDRTSGTAAACARRGPGRPRLSSGSSLLSSGPPSPGGGTAQWGTVRRGRGSATRPTAATARYGAVYGAPVTAPAATAVAAEAAVAVAVEAVCRRGGRRWSWWRRSGRRQQAGRRGERRGRRRKGRRAAATALLLLLLR